MSSSACKQQPPTLCCPSRRRSVSNLSLTGSAGCCSVTVATDSVGGVVTGGPRDSERREISSSLLGTVTYNTNREQSFTQLFQRL